MTRSCRPDIRPRTRGAIARRLLAAAGLAAVSAAARGAADFVESRVVPAADRFEYEFCDLDGDGSQDLLLSLEDRGKRSLQVHFQRQGAFAAEPDWRWSDVPDDITGYAFLDLREEAGAELMLLTRSGVFSASTSRAALRGNLRREISLPLFPDLPPEGPLERWPWTLDLDRDGRDELLVVSGGTLQVLAIDPEGGLAAAAVLPVEPRFGSAGRTRLTMGSSGIRVRGSQGVPRFFPGLDTSRSAPQKPDLLTFEKRLALPTWVDWNLDGRLDALFGGIQGTRIALLEEGLSLAAGAPVAVPAALRPWLREPADPEEGRPDAEDDEENRNRRAPRRPRIRFVDFDGDGRDEVICHRREDGETVALVFTRTPSGELVETPVARWKFAELQADFRIRDVNGDGRRDLVVWTFDVPRDLTSIASLEARVALLVYPHRGDGFAREPALRFRRALQPKNLERIEESIILELAGDFDGDGLDDLLWMQPDGLLVIHAMVGGIDGYSIRSEPFAQYRPREAVRRVKIDRLNPDAVSDLVLVHDGALTLFASRAPGSE